jgi:hypothetical protein
VSEPGGIALGRVEPKRSLDRRFRQRWRARDSGEAGKRGALTCRNGTSLADCASNGSACDATALSAGQALGLDSECARHGEEKAWVNIRFGDTGRRPEFDASAGP